MLEVQQTVKTSRTKDVQQKKGYIMSLPITQEKCNINVVNLVS